METFLIPHVSLTNLLQRISVPPVEKTCTSPIFSSFSFFLVCHGGLAFATENASNLGSVKSTVSSSEARQLLAFEVKRISLSIKLSETISPPLSTQRLRSMSSGSEHRTADLPELPRLSSSASFGPPMPMCCSCTSDSDQIF